MEIIFSGSHARHLKEVWFDTFLLVKLAKTLTTNGERGIVFLFAYAPLRFPITLSDRAAIVSKGTDGGGNTFIDGY